MHKVLEGWGGWRGLFGVVFATGLIAVQVGFIIGDQLAKIWPWAATLGGRVLIVAVGWLLTIAWSTRDSWGRFVGGQSHQDV